MKSNAKFPTKHLLNWIYNCEGKQRNIELIKDVIPFTANLIRRKWPTYNQIHKQGIGSGYFLFIIF
jgi:hypothetical protein